MFFTFFFTLTKDSTGAGGVRLVSARPAPPKPPAAKACPPAGLTPAPGRLRRGCNRLWRRGVASGRAARGGWAGWAGVLQLRLSGGRGGGKTPVILYGGGAAADIDLRL